MTRDDYANPLFSGHHTARLTFELCQSEGVSAAEFRQMARRFGSTQVYPTWAPADFLKHRIILRDYAWAQEQMQAGVEVAPYKLEGWDKPRWGVRSEIGDALPVYTPGKLQPAPALPEPKRDSDTVDLLSLSLQALKLEARVEELERERSRLVGYLQDAVDAGYDPQKILNDYAKLCDEDADPGLPLDNKGNRAANGC